MKTSWVTSKLPRVFGRHLVKMRLQSFAVSSGRVQLLVVIFTGSFPFLQHSTQLTRLTHSNNVLPSNIHVPCTLVVIP